jgi:hypothetical protein
MKIRSLRLEHFRKFTDPVVLTGFTDGVNVLAESNEFGKSTLLAAIRGVLFERHVSKASSVIQMQHWSNKTSPIIALEFELPSGLYKIEKRFLHKEPYARLTMPGGVTHHDEAAEEYLQRVLNFTQAGSKGSKPENVGMWAALWVTQRESVNQPDFTDSARQTIHGCLDQEVGALTGGTRGKKVLASVRAELAKIRDGNKKPAGKYKETVAAQGAAQQSLTTLQTREQKLVKDIAELQLVKRNLADANSGGEEARTVQLLNEAHKNREGAQRFEDQERTALTTRNLWAGRVTSAEKEIETRREQETTLQAVDARIEVRIRDEADAKAALLKAEEARGYQQALIRDAVQTHGQAVASLRAARFVESLAMMSATLQAFRARLLLADASQTNVNTLVARLASLSITKPELDQLRELEKQLRKTEAVLEAQATHLTFTLLPEAADRVRIDGAIIPDGPVSVIRDAVITVKGIGEILIQPGIQDRQTLLSRQMDEERRQRDALRVSSCKDLQHAEELYEARVQCERELAQARQELIGHTPADAAHKMGPGVEALRNQVAVMENHLAAEMSTAGLVVLPEIPVAQEAVREADRGERVSSAAVELARAPLAGLDAEEKTTNRVHAKAESERVSALDEQRRLRIQLDLRLQQESDVAVADRLRTSMQSLEDQQANIQVIERLRPAETVAILDSRIQRLGKAVKDYEAERQSMQQRRAVLQGQITRDEGDGIEELVLAAQREMDQLSREAARYKQETAVLELLLETLESAEQAAKERYMAPVVKRVTPYLQALFPGAAIHCDEQFEITGIIRELQQTETFSSLSVGTQEQIAVLTRLAFADLLLERGQPAAIILDDALAYSDKDRIESLFDLLTEAGTRTQIVILTCRGELFTRLGGNRLKVTYSLS